MTEIKEWADALRGWAGCDCCRIKGPLLKMLGYQDPDEMDDCGPECEEICTFEEGCAFYTPDTGEIFLEALERVASGGGS